MEVQEQQDCSPLTLFYSYADEDEQLCKELEKHLNILQRQETIAGWHRRKILPGTDKNQITDEQFLSAQIIILLISSDFLASDASHAEMELALERHRVGLAHVIPLLLRPVDWERAPFAHLRVLPRNSTPVVQWKHHDEAFADIAKEIGLAIEQWNDPALRLPQRSPDPVSLFFSAAQKDLTLVKRIKDDLRDIGGIVGEQDTKVPQSEQPEQDNNEAVREAIRSASAIILVATPDTRRSRSVKQVLQIAEMDQRPLYAFWMQGDLLPEVLPTGYEHLPCIDARRERYPQALQNLTRALGRQRSSQKLPPKQLATTLSPPHNPYKGLDAFRIEDAQYFFGRDSLIKESLEKVQRLLTMEQQNYTASRLLTVLGPSGSGKSSVVMAGLIPKLKQGGLPNSQHWIYLDPIVPGKQPLEALALTLAPLFPQRSPIKIMHEDLEDDSARGLHLLLTAYVKPPGASVLLVIDQFEELFTQTATEDERRHFLDLLLTAVTEPGGPLITVITLRADFYDRPLLYPELGRIIEDHHVTAYPMEMRDLRTVIELPARLPDVQLTFEEGLVGDLLFDVQGQVGALPLLEFTLDQLFQHRAERLLTLHAYQQISGAKGALAQHAESTYQSLPTEKHQRLARALFLRLINPGTLDEDATRRRIPLSELVVVDPEETARLTEVTNTFTKARLLTTNTVGGVSTVEVSHEALIQAWIRLRDWLHEARDDIRLQQTISEDTASWNRYGQPADRLYRASQLREALRWRAANLPSLDEDRFLQASVKERQGSMRRRTFLIGLVSVAGITGTGSLISMLRRSPSRSLDLHIGSYTYNNHSGIVWSVMWSPDGTRIASGSDDATVQVWDASNGNLQLTYTRHFNTVRSVAWSPDGKYIASAGLDQTVQVWDASNGSLQLTYIGHSDNVVSVAWSPDGKRIASASDDNTAQVWDAWV